MGVGPVFCVCFLLLPCSLFVFHFSLPMVSRCICHDISFAELKKLAEAGARDLEALSRQTGCGTGCGMCIPYIRVMLATGQTDLPVMTNVLPEPPLPSRTPGTSPS